MRPLLSYTQNRQRYGKKENYKLIPFMNTDSFILTIAANQVHA